MPKDIFFLRVEQGDLEIHTFRADKKPGEIDAHTEFSFTSMTQHDLLDTY